MADTRETTNRVAVALILARSAGWHDYTADDLADVDAEGRRALARIARSEPMPGDDRRIRAGYTPSDETWAAMLVLLRATERQPDPFAGFPS